MDKITEAVSAEQDLVGWFDALLRDRSINEGQYCVLREKLTKIVTANEKTKIKIVEVLNLTLKTTNIKYSDFNPRIYLSEEHLPSLEDVDVNVGTDTKGTFISPKTFISTITRLVFGETLAYVVNEDDKIEGVKFIQANEK